MSVLPSFKSAFSSLADAEVSLDVRAADDSGLPSYAATTSIAPQSVQPDRNSPNPWQLPQAPRSPLQKDANNLTRSHLKRHAPEDSPSAPSKPFPLPRPNVAPLPLNLLADDTTNAPAFGFGRSSPKCSIDPFPHEPLPQSDSIPYIQPPQVKTSSTLHCPTYKRNRTQSVSARGSYVKHSSSSSDRRSRPAPQISGANSNSTHTTPNRAQSSPQNSQQPTSSYKPEPLLSHQPTSRPSSPLGQNSIDFPTGRTASQTPNSSLPVQGSTPHGRPGSSDDIGEDSQRQSPDDGKSLSRTHQRGPSSSSLLRGTMPKSSLPIVSFAPPTFSHRSIGSKGNSNPGTYSMLQPVRFIEDSTSRAQADVLGSPRQRSMNSAATAKTGFIPNNSAPIIPLAGGPTASDFSHLLAHTRTQQCSDNLVDGTDNLVDNSGHVKEGSTHAPSPNLNSSFHQRQPVPSEEFPRNSAGLPPHLRRSSSPSLANGIRLPHHAEGASAPEPERTADFDEAALSVTPDERPPQEPWRQNPQPVAQKTPTYRIQANETLKTLRVTNSSPRQYAPLGQSAPFAMRPGGVAVHHAGRNVHANDGQEAYHAQSSQEVRLVDAEPGSQALEAVGSVEDEIQGGHHARATQRVGGITGRAETNGDEGSVRGGAGHVQAGGVRQGRLPGGQPGRQSSGGETTTDGGGQGSNDGGSVQCPLCPRKLRNQVTLQNHIRVVHDNSGNFQCPQCGLTFMWRSTLGNHVRLVHEKQRPHPCPECGKAFRWKSHLREHCWVVHKGEKPFKCEKCGKSFGRKNNMQKHMRKHTEGVT